jgi:hypothetical protein
MYTPDPEAGAAPGEFVYSNYQPTPYDRGITDDLDAGWPPPVNGIRPSQEAVAAHFGFASVAEMEARAELELEWQAEWDDADSNAYQARVEAGLEPEAEL